MRRFRGRTRRELDALRAEVTRQRDELDRRAPSAPATDPRPDRRRFLTAGVAAAAAGVGGALLGAEPAGATTGAMQYGAANDAASDGTSLTSHVASASGATLTLVNNLGASGGVALRAQHASPSTPAVEVENLSGVATRVDLCGVAPIYIHPAAAAGAPTGGVLQHSRGELVVDSAGSLFLCTGSGAPGTWTKLDGQAGTGLQVDATNTNGNPGVPTKLQGSTTGDSMLIVDQNGTASDCHGLRGNINSASVNGIGVIGFAAATAHATSRAMYALNQSAGDGITASSAGGVGVRGSGVTYGVAGDAQGVNGVGVAGVAQNAGGAGLSGSSLGGPGLLLVDNAQTMPPVTNTWVAGSFVVSGGHVWYCYASGAGSASKWVKLSSTLVTLPAPSRVYDSRSGQPNPSGSPQGPLAFGAGARTINCSPAVPAGASTILFNLTVAGSAGPSAGALLVWAAGATEPTASSINWSGPGQVVANAVTSACDASQDVQVKCVASAGSSTPFILDVVGYYL